MAGQNIDELEMSIDVNECQQQYKQIMNNQRYREQVEQDPEEEVEEVAVGVAEGEDLSVATPEVLIQKGDGDLTEAQLASKRQTEAQEDKAGALNIS